MMVTIWFEKSSPKLSRAFRMGRFSRVASDANHSIDVPPSKNFQRGNNMNLRKLRCASLVIAATLLLLQGCSSVSRIEAATPGTTFSLRGVAKVDLPSELRLDSKSTGQHEFKAIDAMGQTLYGLLPLRVNGGRMAGSILFFAPALFIGGFRDAFPVYEVDPDAGLLRFKTTETDDWRLYKPTAAESERAKAYFDTLK